METQGIIRLLMEKQGLSQNALASMCVMKRTTLQTVILPGRTMMPDTVRRILKALKGELVVGGRVITDEFTEKDAVRDMMRELGYTQARLAEACGYKTRQNVSAAFGNKTHMRMDTVLRMTHAMGEKVVIRCGGEVYEITE